MPDHPSTPALNSLFAEAGGVRGVFSTKVADYVAARPGYPEALYAMLWRGLAAVGISAPAAAAVADLGAGTGLLTRGLLAAGYGRVMAVEPNNEMRAAAENTLGGQPGFAAVAGSAEATTLEDSSVDLVTTAQAFHWFDVEAARHECRRILKPHGKAALIWNDRLLSDPLQAALDVLFTNFGGAMRAAAERNDGGERVRQFFDGGEAERGSWEHEHQLDRDRFRSLAFSRSYMPKRESDAGKRAVDAVDRLFDEFATEGLVTMRYLAEVTMGGMGG